MVTGGGSVELEDVVSGDEFDIDDFVVDSEVSRDDGEDNLIVPENVGILG